MKKLKFLITLTFCIVLFSSNCFAVFRDIYSGDCPEGSPNMYWYTSITFDDSGRPLNAVGICCDGTPWSRNYDIVGSPGDNGTTVTLDSYNSDFLNVTANQPVDLQILDLRTGQYVSNIYHYTQPNTVFNISITSLPTGTYGIAAFNNGVAVRLLTFAK